MSIEIKNTGKPAVKENAAPIKDAGHEQAEETLFTLETNGSAYQMKADKYGVLNHLWYGAKTGQNMDYMLDYPDIGFSGSLYEAGDDRTYSLDTRMMEYPGFGMGDYRITAGKVQEKSGASILDLRYKGHQVLASLPELEGLPHLRNISGDNGQTLKIVMEDVTGNIRTELYYSVLEKQDVVARHAVFTNIGKEPVTLENAASACVDIAGRNLDLIHFQGHHNQERSFERNPLPHGITEISSGRGTSSHHHNPAVILADKETTYTHGFAMGAMLVYSGSYAIKIEKDQLDQVRLVMGLNENFFSWKLNPGETFTTPQAIFSWTDEGFDKLSHNFHDLIREHIINPDFKDKERPVLINNWEATYFDFTGDKILDIAKKAADLNIDMLVLDDGWFGKRDSDHSGLGDWFVNEEKLGMPMSELIGKVNDMGLKFGLWFEPEMVNEDSDLYREHPEWALQVPGHLPHRSRYQLVLDYANPEVVDYMYKRMKAILEENPIDYIKWDMNRSITDLYSSSLPANRQKELSHRYVLGLYDLIDRLQKDFPNILFEGCSGGGGRFDAGMLYYTPQIWTSDDTDAHERCYIQHGTSFFYPVSAMGSHVSAVPNHQTGRITSLEARGVTAMHGSFGYELDLNTLSKEEQEEVKKQVYWYKKLQPLIYGSDYYRLNDPYDEDRSIWEYISKDGKHVVVQGLVFAARPTTMPQSIKLKGLNPDATYVLRATNFEEHPLTQTFTGKALMEGGILLPRIWGTDAPITMVFHEVE